MGRPSKLTDAQLDAAAPKVRRSRSWREATMWERARFRDCDDETPRRLERPEIGINNRQSRKEAVNGSRPLMRGLSSHGGFRHDNLT